MQVFKAFFKILHKNMVSMLVYMLVFVSLVILLTLFYQQASPTEFDPQKTRVALINEDAGHPLADGLAAWLAARSMIIDAPVDDASLQDYLFYREVAYILRIPAGFSEKIMAGNFEAKLVRTIVPDSYSGIQMDLLVERYLNIAALYIETLPELDAFELSVKVQSDMSTEAQVIMRTAGGRSVPSRTGFFYLYLAYTIIAVMILGVTTIMLIFNQKDLRRRNQSSPLSLLSFNRQLVLGNVVFALFFWLLMFLLSLVLGDSRDLKEIMLLGLNALVFTLTCLSLGFLIGQFVRGKAAQQSIANVMALGTCFISGVFVPQELLGDTVQTIASFTPTYWYTRAVYEINNLNGYTTGSLREYAFNLLIQIGFAAALLAVSLVAIKSRRQSRD